MRAKSPTSASRRIRDEDSRLNAFILVMADSARQQADQADREIAAGQDRGPLHGVPISIKDLFDITGTATTAASRVREGHVATQRRPAHHPTAPGRRGHRRKNEPARVRVRNDERGLGIRSGAPPVGSDAFPWRFKRRVGREPDRGNGARHRWDRYRRFDPDSRGHLRHRRPQTDVGRAVDRRRGPAVEDARSRWPADEQRH